ncbi:hypothetical protein LTR56_007993 [Elasticomyces elasticus]|nr:hypothetical protein LTR56_007993 [Elasticomyces elasticus]KAK5764144.1 hypothetical protein LTS12_005593 [Elasticomyces elasticus]
MRFTAIISTLVPAFASAALTYNITQALAPGEFGKYHCLTTAKWNAMIPACVRQCQIQANKGDGCAYDDFACHSVNYQVFSDIIELCVFPPSLGGHGTCTLAELGAARPLVQDMGNFFNATLYAAYAGCPIKLSPLKTLGIVAKEQAKVTY